ncbi:MAG: NAD(P)/FAD-dependent oxidoreductase [Planctomycetaceae bacterium]|nr:NAD(P)/FAD-dependent oxidoreductase [Planctomycetaceae bacterium]
MIAATLTARDCAARTWDAVVIGAGPAGGVLAKCLADRRLSVLLVDSKSFPRAKVCGGCLNENSLAAINAAGLRPVVDALHPVPLTEFHLAAGRRSVRLPLPGGIAVSRWGMDAAFVQSAINAGAQFLPDTQAFVGDVTGDSRGVRLESSGGAVSIASRIVIAATGLSGRSVAHLPGFASSESPTSRIGVEATLDAFPADYHPGVIFMAAGRRGYVGLTRVEDGRLNVAAAVDAAAVRDAGSPGAACLAILEEAGFPASADMQQAEWRGTAKLTRSTSRQADTRLFLVGDAAGYVEPFTGEGMAWAMTGAVDLAPLVARACPGWSDEFVTAWEQRYRRLITRRQWVCRSLAVGLRRPRLVRAAVPILQRLPWLAQPIIRRLNHHDQHVATLSTR